MAMYGRAYGTDADQERDGEGTETLGEQVLNDVRRFADYNGETHETIIRTQVHHTFQKDGRTYTLTVLFPRIQPTPDSRIGIHIDCYTKELPREVAEVVEKYSLLEAVASD